MAPASTTTAITLTLLQPTGTAEQQQKQQQQQQEQQQQEHDDGPTTPPPSRRDLENNSTPSPETPGPVTPAAAGSPEPAAEGQGEYTYNPAITATAIETPPASPSYMSSTFSSEQHTQQQGMPHVCFRCHPECLHDGDQECCFYHEKKLRDVFPSPRGCSAETHTTAWI
ncbi:hypothetical protein MKZ38_009568 [Zalerion maritima]|uniref:Uncharacterized protein n=1 Tax=Zalerion maritima TaxID=339359 RepID=A0AAD5RUX5_9PEZI|nr:hypothetical protein MKZ38_009568 [Zalerion maritima]